jgi:histidinol-phosphate/aromatic aminotransferase/cobyric acid decarboxylase-like protein
MDEFREERTRFVKQLNQISWLRVLPSEANYVLCEVKDKFTPRELAVKLLKDYNILIKDCTSKCGGNYIRLAVRDLDDNNKLVSALNSL